MLTLGVPDLLALERPAQRIPLDFQLAGQFAFFTFCHMPSYHTGERFYGMGRSAERRVPDVHALRPTDSGGKGDAPMVAVVAGGKAAPASKPSAAAKPSGGPP